MVEHLVNTAEAMRKVEHYALRESEALMSTSEWKRTAQDLVQNLNKLCLHHCPSVDPSALQSCTFHSPSEVSLYFPVSKSNPMLHVFTKVAKHGQLVTEKICSHITGQQVALFLDPPPPFVFFVGETRMISIKRNPLESPRVTSLQWQMRLS